VGRVRDEVGGRVERLALTAASCAGSRALGARRDGESGARKERKGEESGGNHVYEAWEGGGRRRGDVGPRVKSLRSAGARARLFYPRGAPHCGSWDVRAYGNELEKNEVTPSPQGTTRNQGDARRRLALGWRRRDFG
jgi:hypothetical protein